MNEPTLDQLIETAHLDMERAEADAVAIEQRLKLADLPYSSQWFSQPRAMGTVRNPYAGKHANLTIRAHLEKSDKQLAAYLARQAGASVAAPDYAAQEAQEAREKSIQHLREETERLRQANEATRQRQAAERHANLPNRGGGAFLL
jgi:hypothetical protein